jgi:hypothetical protein
MKKILSSIIIVVLLSGCFSNNNYTKRDRDAISGALYFSMYTGGAFIAINTTIATAGWFFAGYTFGLFILAKVILKPAPEIKDD